MTTMTEAQAATPDPVEDDLRARLEATPDDVETLRLLAVHCAQQQRFDEAAKLVERAVAIAPDDLRLLLTSAGIHANAGDFTIAEKTYRRALALEPGLITAEIGLAQIAESRDNWHTAEEHYRTVLKYREDHIEALLGLGRTRLMQGNPEQAVQIFGRATQLYPQHARALANYGQALLARGTPQVAARPLIRALELDDSLHEARLLLGHAELGRGQPRAAEQAYRGVLERDPSDITARAGLGDALRAQGRFVEAHDEYVKVLAENPDIEGVVAAHAVCLAQSGRVDMAVERLREYIARVPRATGPRLLLSNIYEGAGRPDEALALWREAAERDADDVLAHAELAMRFEALGDFAAASAASQRATTDPRPEIALLRARSAVRDGDNARAQRELLAIEPRDLPPMLARNRYRLLGLVHDRNGRYAEAALAFREAQRIEADVLPTMADPDALAQGIDTLLAAPELETPRMPAPVLLLGLPGSGVERVAALLASHPAVTLRDDRFASQFDLFGDGDDPRMLMETTQQQLAVQARRYMRGVERSFGRIPALLVDWIPAFDARVLAQARRALPGLRTIVVEADAERAFLDWLAFGFQRRFRINDPVDGARWWRVAHAQIEFAAKALPTLRVDADALLDDPAGAGAALAEFLGIESFVANPRQTDTDEPIGNLPTRFPAGHVEHYRDALGQAFSVLR